jgi:hypothetical protein
MTVHNIEGMCQFEEAPNGWKCTIECYPARFHYIKLYAKRFDGSSYPTTAWMLDHIEMLREDMDERISAGFEEWKLEQSAKAARIDRRCATCVDVAAAYCDNCAADVFAARVM